MRTVLRAVLVLVLVGVVVVMVMTLWPAGWSFQRAGAGTTAPNAGTTGSTTTERARERGAEIGEKAAAATKKVQETVAEAALTTKIKAKMALDDTLKSRAIDVSTEGSTVTVSGSVPSAAAHTRAIALVRETAGVSTVVDHLEVVTTR
jgi:osmotically-inducible protein OsmY